MSRFVACAVGLSLASLVACGGEEDEGGTFFRQQEVSECPVAREGIWHASYTELSGDCGDILQDETIPIYSDVKPNSNPVAENNCQTKTTRAQPDNNCKFVAERTCNIPMPTGSAGITTTLIMQMNGTSGTGIQQVAVINYDLFGNLSDACSSTYQATITHLKD